MKRILVILAMGLFLVQTAFVCAESLSDYTNQIKTPGTQRAVHGVITDLANTMPDDCVKQTKIDRDYTFEEFETRPIVLLSATGVSPAGVTGEEDLMAFEDNIFEFHILGAGQTIVAPVMAAAGLDIGMDQTYDEGVEISQGILANSRSAFVVGTAAPFFVSVKFTIGDVTGTDDCAVGFRSVKDYQANIDDYDEMACLNNIEGDIYIHTILNDGNTSDTNTTDVWADTEEHTLAVYVDTAGAVTYLIDGTAPATTAAFSFDTTEVVVPFLYFLNDTDLSGNCTLQSWECGLQ